jgi:predicted RNase H-like HicB family nuclease
MRAWRLSAAYNTGVITFSIDIEQEADGRWIAEIPDLPGVMVYGATPEEARARVQALALRVVADRLEHGEAEPSLLSISFRAA